MIDKVGQGNQIFEYIECLPLRSSQSQKLSQALRIGMHLVTPLTRQLNQPCSGKRWWFWASGPKEKNHNIEQLEIIKRFSFTYPVLTDAHVPLSMK